ncbi:MAG TPA: O-antigen ligase family protein [Solirubrobacteraceae bacterium]|jgi:O-antigen ligase
MRRIRPWLTAASPAAPAVVVLWFGFNSGGFFPVAPAVVAVALALFCVLRLTLAGEPLAGISAGVVAVAALLAALAVWILASSAWSHTPARSLLEFNRLLAYLLGVLAFGSLARHPERLAQAVRFLALAMVILAGAGLITRTLPSVWDITPRLATDRLSYPLTYWNALGLLCGLGMVLAVHLTTSRGEPRVVRLLGAAATPILVATAYLTFSRGGIGAGLVALAIFLVVGRPVFALSGLLAVVAPCAATLLVALNTDALGTQHPRSPAGVAAGHKLIEVVAVAIVAAAVLRLLGLWFDAWLERRLKDRKPWPAWRTAAVFAAGIAVVVVGLVAARAPAFADRQYQRFVHAPPGYANRRARLLDPSNNGRIDLWRVSWREFKAHPLDGVGAGTFQTTWLRKRPNPAAAVDGHSLYLETLGELGVPGLAMVLGAILLLLGGFLVRARGAGRGPPAALLAAGVAWAVHAGIDWDWEMPAVTWWLFALGAMALAAPVERPRLGAPGRMTRVVAALGCLVVAVTPALVIRSQTRLNDAADDLRADNCPAAIDAALDSAAALGVRPEPFQVLGFCDVRLGYGDLAVRAMDNAITRDRENWEFEYSLALVNAELGRDPHPALRRALALNPQSEVVRDAVERLAGNNPRRWRRVAPTLALPIQ